MRQILPPNSELATVDRRAAVPAFLRRNHREVMMRPLYIALSALVLLSACATKDVAPDYRITTDTTEGVVTGSVSYAGRFSGYRIHYRHLVTGKTGIFETGQAAVLIPIVDKGDFETQEMRGTVFAIALPAGEYEANRWSIGSGRITVSSTAPFTIRFTVVPGNLVYLGNFHFTQTAAIGLAVTGATLSYRDAAERDLPVIGKKFPGLAGTPMAHAIEKGAEWKELGGQSSAHMDVPIYIPRKR